MPKVDSSRCAPTQQLARRRTEPDVAAVLAVVDAPVGVEQAAQERGRPTRSVPGRSPRERPCRPTSSATRRAPRRSGRSPDGSGAAAPCRCSAPTASTPRRRSSTPRARGARAGSRAAPRRCRRRSRRRRQRCSRRPPTSRGSARARVTTSPGAGTSRDRLSPRPAIANRRADTGMRASAATAGAGRFEHLDPVVRSELVRLDVAAILVKIRWVGRAAQLHAVREAQAARSR